MGIIDGYQADIGSKLMFLRLNKNITQSELADIMGASRTAVQSAEKGSCSLKTLIQFLHALGETGILENLLPDRPVSPILLAKSQQIPRRASGQRATSVTSLQEEPLEW